jgi:hypothetical protein
MPQNKPRLLVVSTQSWIGVEPSLRAFERAGFAVALVHGQAGHAPHDASIVLFQAGPLQFRHTVEHAIRLLAPDLVIPTDDFSCHHLRALYDKYQGNRGLSPIAKIIANSFGDPAAHERVASSAALQHFAREHGLPVPNTVAVKDEATLRALLESVPLPVVLKDDGGWGGARTELVRSVEAGIAAYHRIATAVQGAKWKEQHALNRLSDLLQPRQRSVFLRQYIDGVAAKSSVACRDGKVLACVSVEPLDGSGLALVAKIINHPGMAAIASLVVTTLKLSGIVGFDFILEHGSRRAWLIAVKPYATSVSQLAPVGEVSLPEALHADLTAGRDRLAGEIVTLLPAVPRTLPLARALLPPPDHFADGSSKVTGTHGRGPGARWR